MFWNGNLRTIIISYLKFGTQASMGLSLLYNENKAFTMKSMVFHAMGFLVVTMPILTQIFLVKKREKIVLGTDGDFKPKFSLLYRDTRYNQKQGVALYKMTEFFVFRICYVLLPFLFYRLQGLQIINFHVLTLMHQAYILHSKPEFKRRRMRATLSNELLIGILVYHLYLFSASNISITLFLASDFSFVFFFGILCITNLGRITIDIL